jgi:hypothetical protein
MLKNHSKYSTGPSTLPLSSALVRAAVRLLRDRGYFQGDGGTGMPFFQGLGGTGIPFFQGLGGTGIPLAIITGPSPWAVTTIFRPIAPTRTNITNKTTVSNLDIVPP